VHPGEIPRGELDEIGLSANALAMDGSALEALYR